MLNTLWTVIVSSAIGFFIFSFVIGAIPMGWLLVKIFYKKDLHQHGSGNVGASNVLATTHNYFLTAIVVIFDTFKGFLCMYLASIFNLPIYIQLLAGIGAVLGHDYSIFLKFSGGRGVLTTLGIYFYISPWLGLIALVAAFALAPFHQIAVGTVCAVVINTLLVATVPSAFNILEPAVVSAAFSILAIILMTRRLIAHRSSLSKNDPIWKIALCRIFFDRDITNREAWINQDRTA